MIESELYKLAKRAFNKDEVPVACIIVKNNKIISKAYNLKERKKNPLYHAEIIAIKKACKKEKSWRLDECELYVTLKPCNLCIEAIKSARIKKVYYYIENSKEQSNKIVIEKKNDEGNKFKELLTTFFKSKR